MSIKTSIGWAERSWSPISGCSPVSSGCTRCYAARMAGTRLQHHPKYKGLTTRRGDGSYRFTGEIRLHEEELQKPLHWRKQNRIFVCSMCDLFHKEVPFHWIRKVLSQPITSTGKKHLYLLLTKRPARMLQFYETYPFYAEHLENIRLGVTAENQKRWDERKSFLSISARNFVSLEPLLGPIDLNMSGIKGTLEANTPDQIIIGAETGPRRRPPKPEWIADIVGQCKKAGVPIFLKDNLQNYWTGKLIQEFPE